MWPTIKGERTTPRTGKTAGNIQTKRSVKHPQLGRSPRPPPPFVAMSAPPQTATLSFSETSTPTGSMQLDSAAGPSNAQAPTPTKAGVQTRQKRILPARSRRGGPGVGSCDADVMIIDTLKRQRALPASFSLYLFVDERPVAVFKCVVQ